MHARVQEEDRPAGRRNRTLPTPFSGLRSPASCLQTMKALAQSEPTPMQRVVAVHALAKAVRRGGQQSHLRQRDADTLAAWLSTFLDPSLPGAGHDRGQERSNCELQRDACSRGDRSGLSRVAVLRERAAVLLLYSLARLHKAGGAWSSFVQQPAVRRLTDELLDHVAGMTSDLDAQVRCLADELPDHVAGMSSRRGYVRSVVQHNKLELV